MIWAWLGAIPRHKPADRYVSDQSAIARAGCNHMVTVRNDRK
jgi:hypothetical protein